MNPSVIFIYDATGHCPKVYLYSLPKSRVHSKILSVNCQQSRYTGKSLYKAITTVQVYFHRQTAIAVWIIGKLINRLSLEHNELHSERPYRRCTQGWHHWRRSTDPRRRTRDQPSTR